MSVIKDGIQHICRRLDDIRGLMRDINQESTAQSHELAVIRRELVTQNNTLCDLMEKLEEAQNANSAPTITVKPVDTSKGETLFLVTGDELCNLLEACKGATVRMKERKGTQETE